MKSVRTKIVILVLFGTILSALVVGILSIQNIRLQIERDSTDLMHQSCKNSGQEINAAISRIEQSVETLADCAVNGLDDLRAFQSNPEYVEEYTDQIENTLLMAAENTEGAVTAYLRYNPEFTEPTSGLFFTRDSTSSAFQKLVPTDFSIYDKSDTAHVGWYYIPVENKKATWMSPYLNENLQVYMISYVIPLYKDGVSIGIVGMDIDFSLIQKIVDETDIYETGYAFLTDADHQIMYHKELEVNTDISQQGPGLEELLAALKTEESMGTLIPYEYGGTRKMMTHMALKNGMRLVLTAPSSEINARANRLMFQILGSTVAAVAVSVLISLLIIRGIVRPLEELNRAARQIADGDLDVTVSCRSRDEIGNLAVSIESTVKRLKEYIDYIGEISDVLDQIADGNLVFKLNYAYEGEFSRVKESLNHISYSLNHTLLEINRASELVTNGSGQVASGAQALSQGATEQAASVEQLSMAVQDILGQVNRNSENANEASLLAREAGGNVEESNRNMREMTAAMTNIAEVSGKINNIVRTVEDIASQTNILALNAAVEAARAGEAGKSFAVVAGEVRSLSVKVDEATKNIARLVQDAITAIDSGTAIVGKTEASLKTVVEKSSEIETKIQDIAAASEGQANSIEQVNQGLSQISSVVQTNSATAQEEAAASEEMSSQAQILRNLIGRFNLKKE